MVCARRRDYADLFGPPPPPSPEAGHPQQASEQTPEASGSSTGGTSTAHSSAAAADDGIHTSGSSDSHHDNEASDLPGSQDQGLHRQEDPDLDGDEGEDLGEDEDLDAQQGFYKSRFFKLVPLGGGEATMEIDGVKMHITMTKTPSQDAKVRGHLVGHIVLQIVGHLVGQIVGNWAMRSNGFLTCCTSSCASSAQYNRLYRRNNMS